MGGPREDLVAPGVGQWSLARFSQQPVLYPHAFFTSPQSAELGSGWQEGIACGIKKSPKPVRPPLGLHTWQLTWR